MNIILFVTNPVNFLIQLNLAINSYKKKFEILSNFIKIKKKFKKIECKDIFITFI